MSAHRRDWLKGAGASLAGLFLSACDQLNRNPAINGALARTEGLTKAAQRLVVPRTALAPEFTRAEISPDFRANGSTDPDDPAYRAHVETGFADWRLVVDGLVDTPLSLGLGELRAMPGRTQITRHDCVEGWSSIGEWTGAQLGAVLERAGLRPEARFIVFHCADYLGPKSEGRYYESIDLIDAFHPQTILAYEMNGQALPVKHGAPVRLRVERQLGYKHAKYVMRIEAVDDLAAIGRGKGGYWEDWGDYAWYAGI
jgi:DMSO/TMAO reductase YedYZ molybdopterin-dependent catalytic subunit